MAIRPKKKGVHGYGPKKGVRGPPPKNGVHGGVGLDLTQHVIQLD